MDILEACLKNDGRQAVNALRRMAGSAKPSALWAILMHAASWQEERSYDTPHSTIKVYATHRMIEDLGPNEKLLDSAHETVMPLVSEEFRIILQNVLVQRLAYHLGEVDHWRPGKGPKYNVETSLDSLSNAVQNLELSIRKRSHIGALKAAMVLGGRTDPVHLMRAAATLAAEEPDRLGHGFILPVSLISELPIKQYTRPQVASLWHLAEYMVRKVPSRRKVGSGLDASISKYAKTTDVSDRQNLFAAGVVDYGTLGHNGIFAHRIAEAASKGWVDDATVEWLFKMLQRNIGEPPETTNLADLVKKTSGTDWPEQPTYLRLPDSSEARDWLQDNVEWWGDMMDSSSSAFESLIPSLKEEEFQLVRASQYAMSTINGTYGASHVVIFTHAVWSLVDHKLVPVDLAALQVHRMLREYLKGR
jgi:hypothetical protein